MSISETPINVVICTHDRLQLLQRTLESLQHVEQPPTFEHFWIIENGSDSGAQQMCAEFASTLPLEYRNLKPKGKSRALQYSLDEIRRGLVIFTDDDVRVVPGWLKAYAKQSTQSGPNFFYGGPLYIDYEVAPADWMLSHMPPSVRGWQLDNPTAPITKPCFLGANYAAYVENLQAVGGFKTSLGMGATGNPIGEEFAIEYRLLANGYKAMYVGDAPAWHYVPRNRSSIRWVLNRYERIWFTNGMTDNKHHPGRRIFGIPGWMWRSLVFYATAAVRANLITDAERRFEIKKSYYQWKGYVRGVKMRQMHSE